MKNLTFVGEIPASQINAMNIREKIKYYYEFGEQVYKKHLIQLAKKQEVTDYKNLKPDTSQTNTNNKVVLDIFKIHEEVEKTFCNILDDFLTRRGFET